MSEKINLVTVLREYDFTVIEYATKIHGRSLGWYEAMYGVTWQVVGPTFSRIHGRSLGGTSAWVGGIEIVVVLQGVICKYGND